jgi:hypothetical protein
MAFPMAKSTLRATVAFRASAGTSLYVLEEEEAVHTMK